MTKQEMIDYIEGAKKDIAVRRLMKTRKVQDVELSYSKVVITIAYKAVKQIKKDLGRQKIQIMFYGKKEFECDKYKDIPKRKGKLISQEQESSKRSLRKVIIKSCLTGEEFTFYNAKFMASQGLFRLNSDGRHSLKLGFQELKTGDKLYRTLIYKNDTDNYVLDEFWGEYHLYNERERAFYEEYYEVISVEDKPQNYLVYQITNDIDDIKYFGITNNYKQRYSHHFKIQKEDKMLYHHMNYLGKEHFKMEVIYENIPTKRLAEKIETILILGNIGKTSNEILSCSNWYKEHLQLNDFDTTCAVGLFDKERDFLAYYHYYQDKNYIRFISHANYENHIEFTIRRNLRELGLNIDTEHILSYDRNKVVLK